MHRGSIKLFCLVTLAGLLAATACGKDDSQTQELQAAKSAALAELEQAKASLDAKRGELRQLQEKIANPEPQQEGGEATEAVDIEALKAQAQTLKGEIEDDADDLTGRVVAFINQDPPIAGEPLSPELARAVDMKVDEDIHLAREYIEVGGDYKKAITILEQMQPLAPDNERLLAELEKAKSDRWMTEERFAVVKEGFTEDQVREALGQANLRNIKVYPDRGVTAWFYLKGEDNSAAGVYFKERKGKQTVYKADFNAVKAAEDRAGDDS
jgi:hypothetical protein